MTNYLTGSEATQLMSAGGDLLELGVDGTYSIMMFGINFTIANFLMVLLLIVIAIIVNYGRKKVFGGKTSASIVR